MANAAKASQRKAGRATAPKEVPRKKKRAIALAGGGPAAGLHIGALEALEQHGVAFDVWSLSCIGAWVGVYYNQLKKHPRASQTHAFFREHAFRDSASYRGFPVNKAFAPHLQAYTSAWLAHSLDPQTYWNAFNFGNELPDARLGRKGRTWRRLPQYFLLGARQSHGQGGSRKCGLGPRSTA